MAVEVEKTLHSMVRDCRGTPSIPNIAEVPLLRKREL